MTIDKEKLRALALAATPGRNFDRLPESGGGLKYECTGDDESLVLKVDHRNSEFGFVGDKGEQDEAFFLACTPATVLALLDEIERLEKRLRHHEQWHTTRFETLWHWAHKELAEPQLTQYFSIVANGISHPDHPPTYAQRLNSLIGRFEAVEKERDQLKAENEALRKDAARLDRLDLECEAYGVDYHEGNRWEVDGPFVTVRDAIDAAIAKDNPCTSTT